MTLQRALIAVALASGALAGILYYAGTQRVVVLVAAQDLEPGTALSDRDVTTAAIPPDAVPRDILTSVDTAIGRFARVAIARGQLLLRGSLVDAPAAFGSGMPVPSGAHAVAIPVDAAHALGGAVVPGARVDVIAVPARRDAIDGREQRTTELVVSAALVLDVRGEQGAPVPVRVPPERTVAVPRDRIGSVVIAVTPEAELWIADRIPTSTFVLALVPEK